MIRTVLSLGKSWTVAKMFAASPSKNEHLPSGKLFSFAFFVAQAIDSVHAQIVSTETELEKAKEIQEVEDTKPPSKIDDDNASDSDLGVGDDTLVQDSIIVQEAYIDGSNILAEPDKDLNNGEIVQ